MRCKDMILSMANGGEYYVGISGNVKIRLAHHRTQWSWMTILAAGDGPDISRLEGNVLDEGLYPQDPKCMNRSRGGARGQPRKVPSLIYVCTEPKEKMSAVPA